MKNKRNVLIAFILICCLCLSIGYAALTDTLYVDGTVGVNIVKDGEDTTDTPFEENLRAAVYWSVPSNAAESGVTVSTTTEAQSNLTGTDDTTDTADKPDVLVISVGQGVLTSEGDSTTIKAVVNNSSSDYDITAALNSVTCNNANLTVTWKWADNSTGSKDIAEGGSAEVAITVTLTTAPTSDINTTFTMTCTANAK